MRCPEIPTFLGEEDFLPDEIGLDPETRLIPLSGGLNSRAYRLGTEGDQVIKIGKSQGSLFKMNLHWLDMQAEFDCLKYFMHESLPDTTYDIVPTKDNPNNFRVISVQEFIDGQLLPDYIADPCTDKKPVIGFLAICLHMYHKTKTIPDIANVQDGFSVFTNTNVVVTRTTSGIPIPILTDTNFGRIQKSKLGRLWSVGIAHGAKSAKKSLEKAA